MWLFSCAVRVGGWLGLDIHHMACHLIHGLQGLGRPFLGASRDVRNVYIHQACQRFRSIQAFISQFAVFRHMCPTSCSQGWAHFSFVLSVPAFLVCIVFAMECITSCFGYMWNRCHVRTSSLPLTRHRPTTFPR
jgi:hypothetical protein